MEDLTPPAEGVLLMFAFVCFSGPKCGGACVCAMDGLRHRLWYREPASMGAVCLRFWSFSQHDSVRIQSVLIYLFIFLLLLSVCVVTTTFIIIYLITTTATLQLLWKFLGGSVRLVIYRLRQWVYRVIRTMWSWPLRHCPLRPVQLLLISRLVSSQGGPCVNTDTDCSLI